MEKVKKLTWLSSPALVIALELERTTEVLEHGHSELVGSIAGRLFMMREELYNESVGQGKRRSLL